MAIAPTIDIAVTQNSDWIYDVSFDSNGDFVLDDSYETSIRMSLFLDIRADESEVKQEPQRRGWWGNFELYNVLHEVGSKLWLLEQKRNTVKTRNDAKGYIQDSLQWMIDDGHVQKIEVESSSTSIYELTLTITITYSADILQSFRFSLWGNTTEL